MHTTLEQIINEYAIENIVTETIIETTTSTPDFPLLIGSLRIDISSLCELSAEKLVELSAKNPLLKIESEGKHILIINQSMNHLFNQKNLTELLGELFVWNKTSNDKKGVILDSGGSIEFADGSVKMPDITYVLREKLQNHPKGTVLLITPDFVVEYVSTYDSLKEAKEKMNFYMQQQVPLAWLIVPKETQTYIYKPNEIVKTCPFDEFLDGENILANFSIRLSDIFE